MTTCARRLLRKTGIGGVPETRSPLTRQEKKARQDSRDTAASRIEAMPEDSSVFKDSSFFDIASQIGKAQIDPSLSGANDSEIAQRMIADKKRRLAEEESKAAKEAAALGVDSVIDKKMNKDAIAGLLGDSGSADKNVAVEDAFLGGMSEYYKALAQEVPEVGDRKELLKKYMQEFSEATGIPVGEKVDKSQALMAMGLSLILNSHDIIKIDRTRLRIIDTKVPLAEAIPLSELEDNLSWLNQSFLAICLSFFCLSFLLLSKHLGSVQEFSLIKSLPSELGQLAVFCLWPLSFAILAKVVKKESHIVSQFNLTLLVILLVNGLILLQKIAIFNINPGTWFTWIELVIFATLVSSFIWLSLFIAFHQTNHRRNIIACSITFMILAPIYALGFLNTDEFSARPHYNSLLLPPTYNITSASQTDKFIVHANSLFTQVDKLKVK